MTGREINQLTPGMWVKGPTGLILEFKESGTYIRSSTKTFWFLDHTTKDMINVQKHHLLEWDYKLLEDSDNRVKAIKVLYGRSMLR